MQVLRAVVAFSLLLGLVACGESDPTLMPTVVGQKLDVALTDIKSAGFTKDVEIVGGGVFGIVDKSNWTVCEQEPAAGQAITKAPRLKVDRTCSGASASPTPTLQETSRPASSAPAEPSTPSASTVLTVQNNADFAAISVLGEYCDPAIGQFARTYAGRTIQFDGSIAAMSNHGNTKTRFDILVHFGDNGKGTKGPSFQFRDVNLSFDLKLEGANIPDSVNVGDNLRIEATVVAYESTSCLFLLQPVATQYR